MVGDVLAIGAPPILGHCTRSRRCEASDLALSLSARHHGSVYRVAQCPTSNPSSPPPPLVDIVLADVLCGSHMCADGFELIPDREGNACANNSCDDEQCCQEEAGEQRTLPSPLLRREM